MIYNKPVWNLDFLCFLFLNSKDKVLEWKMGGCSASYYFSLCESPNHMTDHLFYGNINDIDNETIKSYVSNGYITCLNLVY